MLVSEIPYTEEYVEVPSRHKVPQDSVQLGFLECFNVNIQLEVNKPDQKPGMTTLTLREVPKFLVDAFKTINANIEVKGLFRKSSNMSRLNKLEKRQLAIFCGREPIPDDLSVFDICSLTKQFFQNLKVPLFCYQETREKLLEFVERKERGDTISVDDVYELFRPRQREGKSSKQLPESHIGTIGYLMRQLYNIAQHKDSNGMDAPNLATVFGPTLLGHDLQKIKTKKSVHGRISNVGLSLTGENDDNKRRVDEAKLINEKSIKAILILIEKANWIGLNRECYVSSQLRSSSAAPLHRTPLAQVQPLPLSYLRDKRPSLKTPNELEALRIGETHYYSDTENYIFNSDDERSTPKMKSRMRKQARRSLNFIASHLSPMPSRAHRFSSVHRDGSEFNEDFGIPDSQARNHGRRSSSVAMKEIFTNVFSRRRKSAERTSTASARQTDHLVRKNKPAQRELSEGAISRTPHGSGLSSTSSGHQSRSRMRPERDSPKRAPLMLDIVSVDPSQPSMSRHPVRSNTYSSSSIVSGNDVNVQRRSVKQRSTNRHPTPGPCAQQGLKMTVVPRLGSFTPEFNSPVLNSKREHKNAERICAPDFDEVDSPSPPHAMKSKNEQMKYKDPAVSLITNSFGDEIGRPERRRRHTTPVKCGGLRRNQPNTIAVGLKPRRNTQTITAEEKENVKKRRSHSVEDVESTDNSCDDVIDGHDERSDAAAIREQMGLEYRQRRAKKQRRRESVVMSTTVTTDFAHAATSPRMDHTCGTFIVPRISPPKAGVISNTNSPHTPSTSSGNHSPRLTTAALTPSTKTPVPQYSPQRILQVTPTNSPVVHKSPMSSNCNESPHLCKISPSQCSHPTIVISSNVSRRSSVPVVIQEQGKSINIQISPETIRAPSSSSQRSFETDVHMKSERGSTDMLTDRGSCSPLPAPTSTSSQPTNSSTYSANTSPINSSNSPLGATVAPGSTALLESPQFYHPIQSSSSSSPRNNLRPQLSLDSGLMNYCGPLSPRLSRNCAGRVPLSPGTARPTIAPKPAHLGTPQKTLMGPPPIPSTESPLGRKGKSTSGFERPSPMKPLNRQLSADEFNNSDRIKMAMLSTQSSSELYVASGRTTLEQRPSVAFIAHQRKGLVKDRVNLFGGQSYQQLETIGQRGPSTSGRSSIESDQSEFEFAKPAIPPVSRTMGKRPPNVALTRYHSIDRD